MWKFPSTSGSSPQARADQGSAACSQGVSLSGALLSGTLWTPHCLVLGAQQRSSTQAAAHPLPLCYLPWGGLETLKAGGWGHRRTQLIRFTFPMYHCPSLPDVQCFKNCCFIYCPFWMSLVNYISRVSPAYCYFILPGSGHLQGASWSGMLQENWVCSCMSRPGLGTSLEIYSVYLQSFLHSSSQPYSCLSPYAP